MRQTIAVAATTFLLFSSAQAADLPATATPAGTVGVFGLSRVDRATITACEAAIAQWAAQFAPTDIDTAITAPVRGRSGEVRTAVLFVKIAYPRQGGIETRSATIECKVAADGAVAVAEAP